MTQSRNADKFVCRLPDGMREQLANVAAMNRRSMNSEVVYRLETSLAGAGSHKAKAEALEALKLMSEDIAMLPRVRSASAAAACAATLDNIERVRDFLKSL